MLRSNKRFHSKGSVFLLSVLAAVRPADGRFTSWPHGSSTTPSGSEDACRAAWISESDGAAALVLKGSAAHVVDLTVDPRPKPLADQVLHASAHVELLQSWVHAVTSGAGLFACAIRAHIQGSLAYTAGRCRDLLPLPVVTRRHIEEYWREGDHDVLFLLLQIACASLNYLFCSGCPSELPSKATHLHLTVIQREWRKLQAMWDEITVCEVGPVERSFGHFCGAGSARTPPLLTAQSVDVLPRAGLVNPLDFIDKDSRTTLTTPGLLFPDGLAGAEGQRVCREPRRGERVALTLAMLRSGRLKLAHSSAAAADTFIVGKRSGGKCREVWNGARLTILAARAPKPPLLASPSSLATLEGSDDRPVRTSCRDGRIFFDQLAVPSDLMSFFGRPLVRVADLLDPPACESGDVGEPGLSAAELENLLVDGPLRLGTTSLVPLAACWPMGFGWSSFLAQSTMLGSVVQAGFVDGQIMSHERRLLPEGGALIAVATDDINHFERMSTHELESRSEVPLAALDRVWRRMKIQGHETKAIDTALDAKVLGIQIRGGVQLQACGDKVIGIMQAVIELSRRRKAAPAAVASLNGHLHWQSLVTRPLLSCFDKIYGFVRREPQAAAVHVDGTVLDELLLSVSLCGHWSCDLRKPWLPKIFATDASPSFGYGMCVADCHPSLTRSIAAADAEGDAVVRLTQELGDPPEVARAGSTCRLPLTLSSFKTQFSVKATSISHSGCMELHAVVMALLRVARSSCFHGSRGVMLVDATAVGSALRKGRSSAGSFKRGMSAAAAVLLAADLAFSFPYLPSESNPADWPSRGRVRVRPREIARSKKKIKAVSKFDARVKSLRQSIRRLVQCGALSR
jgi:hypothetical protein